MSVKSLETLNTWVKAKEFVLRVYREVVPLLPVDEKWSMAQQIRRSSNSIPANIAEGYDRFHYLDNAKFCSNARGSCYETLDHLITANDEEMISTEMLSTGRNLVNEAGKILNGYIKYLQSKAST